MRQTQEIEALLCTSPAALSVSDFICRSSPHAREVLSLNKFFKLKQRALHAFGEARRVMKFRALCESESSLSSDAMLDLGKLMNESHDSCRHLYECSCEELDAIQSQALKLGALGCRLTGAGWGGMTVSLVRRCHVNQFVAQMKAFYLDEYCAEKLSSSYSEETPLVLKTELCCGASAFSLPTFVPSP